MTPLLRMLQRCFYLSCSSLSPDRNGGPVQSDRSRQIFVHWVIVVVAILQVPTATRADSERLANGLPAGQYDSAVKSPERFFGAPIGDRHLRHHELVDYFVYLPTVSEYAKTERYALSHGNRPLLATIITSPENHGKLDELLQAHRQLCDPSRSSDLTIASLPLVMYMGYGVHGDEPSGSHAATLVAHYLCAGPGRELLDDMIVIVDPSLNPDGFDRFSAWANAYRGTTLNADPAHREHVQDWPGGRVNYYWFDLNRDWMPLQHPESQGRAELFFRFRPNVVLDFHEMSTNSTYFFQPGVPTRKHPDTPDRNQRLTRQLATYHAQALDEIGSLYYTEERYDDFYMGKGSTYPDLHGAVGILFEQASSRGHVQESVNGRLSFAFTIRNQVTTSLSSLRGATQHREALLDFQRDFYRTSLMLAEEQPVRAFEFECPGNPQRLVPFAHMLKQHHIHSIRQADKLIVPTDQPEYRFLKSLLDRRTSFEENVFYDVSTWNMQYAYGLKMRELESMPQLNTLPIDSPAPSLHPRSEMSATSAAHLRERLEQSVAVVIDWHQDAAAPLLYQLLATEALVKVAQSEFSYGERRYPHGTLLMPLGPQREKQPQIAELLKAGSADYQLLATGLSPVGVDLGSSSFARLERPETLVVIGRGVSRYQSGAIWHYFDTRVKMPVSLTDIDDLNQLDLSRYRCIILPQGSYGAADDAAARIASWCKSGGILIALGNSVRWAAKHNLVAESFLADEVESTEPDSNQRRPYASRRNDRALNLISGAIFATEVDTTHPLGYGFPNQPLAVFRTSTLRLNRSASPYASPVVYTADPLLAGYASDENVERLTGSACVTHTSLGLGRIIMIADDPTFRAFWHGTQKLMANAVFFGPLIRD